MADKGFYRKTVRSDIGAAIQGAEVTVNNTDGTPATIEDAQGAALTQPLVTDASGTFEFYALFGTYDITVTYSNQTVELPLQLIGPDQESLASAGSEVGQAALFATGLPLGNYLPMDGGEYSTGAYPDLAPLMEGLGNSYSQITSFPALAGRGTGVVADADNVYFSHFGTPALTVIDKSSWTINTTDWPGFSGSAYAIAQDDSYVYLGYDESPFLQVIDKVTGGTLAAAPVPPETVRHLHVDSDYLYVFINSAPYLKIYAKSDWAEVTGGPALSASASSVDSDTTRLYVGLSSSPYYQAFEKGTWTEQSGTVSFGGELVTLFVYDGFLYTTEKFGNGLQVVDVSTDTKTETSAYDPTAQIEAISAAGDSLYLGTGAGLDIISRTDYSVIASPPVGTQVVSLFVTSDAVFLGLSSGDYSDAYEIISNGFKIPAVASPDPILEYRVRAK